MMITQAVFDSSAGPYEFEIRVVDGRAELWLPGVPDPIIVRQYPIRVSIDVPGSPRPIRVRSWRTDAAPK